MMFLAVLFFLTALVYSTVGFGGGSTYLALLLLWGLPHTEIPKIALMCNLIVVASSAIRFCWHGYVGWNRFFLFILASIPFAYIGGRLSVGRDAYLVLSAASLAVAGIRLLFVRYDLAPIRPFPKRAVWTIGLASGAIIGVISGMIGIGGGIFLAPILYFLQWGSAREIAGLSSMFILLNSLAALAGQITKGASFEIISASNLWLLCGAVFVGGQIGSRLGVKRFSAFGLQQVTGCLILLVAFRVAWALL